MRPNARGVAIDRTSLLAEVDADVTLGELEDALALDGLTLAVEGAGGYGRLDRERVGAWLAGGAAGAPDPWSDPVDHLVAGLDALLPDGRALAIRPAPRRAVGPDLVALTAGMGGRLATIVRVTFRVHPRGVARRETEPFVHDRDPPLDAGEEALLAHIAKELGG